MKTNHEYICYCFKHTQKAIEDDTRQHGRSTIMEAIIAESQSGQCNCKTTNPKGR